jgi:ribosome recycling factor
MNDGMLIRLSIPRLTEERRRELVKVVSRRVEEARIAVRNLRRDALQDLKEFEKEKMISEDEFFRGKDKVQELTDEFVEEIDGIGKRKEEEVMEI